MIPLLVTSRLTMAPLSIALKACLVPALRKAPSSLKIELSMEYGG
jgi:hypothetical protein